MGKVEELLRESDIFLDSARDELQTGLAKNDTVRIRDFSKKAWNAVVQAKNAFIASLFLLSLINGLLILYR